MPHPLVGGASVLQKGKLRVVCQATSKSLNHMRAQPGMLKASLLLSATPTVTEVRVRLANKDMTRI